ncbi:MAG: hypothetical protein KKD35_02035 [Elusimicrobia bacterium]|nr:hypothetical protein [Elusimicrobiota bacterium]
MRFFIFIRQFVLVAFLFICIFSLLTSGAFADAVSPVSVITLSTPTTTNVLIGRLMPPELKQASWQKYNYEAGIGLFGESYKAYPTMYVLAGKGKNTIAISYFNSKVPFIKDEYDFLRSNNIAVKRTVSSVLVKVGTVTYTVIYINDEISRFHSRTQILDFFYIRDVIDGNEKYKLAFMAGIPIGYNSYSLRCALDDASIYSESGASFGSGLSAGLKFTAANSLFLNKGFVFSLGAIYRKLWFKNIAGKIDGPLRSEISGWRVFINTGWRFNFYN